MLPLVVDPVHPSRISHRERSLPQSSSASRFTAGAAGFLNFSQSFERPERQREPSRFDTMPSRLEPASVANSLSVSVSYKGALLFPSK
jgi:hypothetical protein